MIRTKSKISRNWIERAATELNEVMGLRPCINLDDDDQRMLSQIKAASAFINEGDAYTPTTWLLMGYENEVFERKTS
ncbi:MAG: hypothetical protein PHG14_11165 [Desulfobacter postgatei]|uniref:hypothetical protein n=1 Tax=Desulfobacter postgatei TaxID=2293 RepID=UPI0023F2645C|nr:hypothetical protein [Desulfobacter postgatei]MDD4274273.1 hypothetical protein [Desulfobacter postgatei]